MKIDVLVEYDEWSGRNIEKVISAAAKAVFSFLRLNDDGVEICVLCTDDNEIRTLNKTYRGIDKSTNVLSFPAEPYFDENCEDFSCEEEFCECENHQCSCEGCHCSDDDPKKMCVLGSIALAFETIERESQEQGKTFLDHVTHLVIHSVLHLLGYDHIESDEAEKMEELEILILQTLNIENPY